METIIHSLIGDDIRLNRENRTLQLLGWITESRLTNNLNVICELMNIELSDDVINMYYAMVDDGKDINFTIQQREQLTKRIYTELTEKEFRESESESTVNKLNTWKRSVNN
jgi:hypothetical protein